MHDGDQGDGPVATGTLDGDLLVPPLAQARGDDAGSEFGRVAVAAEVAEDDAGEAGAGDLTDEFGGLLVGEVAVAVADALLRRPGTLRVVLEEGFVIVRLGEKGVDTSEPIDDHSRDMADIAENSQTAVAALEAKSDRVDGIVGHGKGLDFDSVDLEGVAGFELLPGHARLHAFAHDRAGVGRGVDGETTLAAKDVDPAGVITVLVGEDDGSEAVGINPDLSKTGAELACREARIDKDASLFVADEGTVALTAAAEDCQF